MFSVLTSCDFLWRISLAPKSSAKSAEVPWNLWKFENHDGPVLLATSGNSLEDAHPIKTLESFFHPTIFCHGSWAVSTGPLSPMAGVSSKVKDWVLRIWSGMVSLELGSSFVNQGNKCSNGFSNGFWYNSCWIPFRCSKSWSLQLHTSKPSQVSKLQTSTFPFWAKQIKIPDKLLFCLHNRSFTSLASHDGWRHRCPVSTVARRVKGDGLKGSKWLRTEVTMVTTDTSPSTATSTLAKTPVALSTVHPLGHECLWHMSQQNIFPVTTLQIFGPNHVLQRVPSLSKRSTTSTNHSCNGQTIWQTIIDQPMMKPSHPVLTSRRARLSWTLRS